VDMPSLFMGGRRSSWFRLMGAFASQDRPSWPAPGKPGGCFLARSASSSSRWTLRPQAADVLHEPEVWSMNWL
jgi:hypothetical protein